MILPKRLYLSAVLTTALVMVGAPSALSAGLAGSTCKNLGQKKVQSNKTYTCVKSGKKLVWSKGVAIALPKPTPTPSPTPTTPKVLTVEERWDATGSNALSVYRKNAFVSDGKTPQLKVIYDFSPRMWAASITEMKRRMDNSVAFWDRFHTPSFNVYFTAGTYEDLEWGCQILNSHDSGRTLQGCRDDQKNELANNFHVSRGYDIAGGSNPWYLIQSPEVLDAQAFWPRIEHEYVHSIQEDLLRDDFRFVVPCWVLEGSPEYLGILMASQGNAKLFLDQRIGTVQGWREGFHRTASAEELAKWFEDASITWSPRPPERMYDRCEPYRNTGMYHWSVLGTEWMVDRIGVKGMVDLYKNLKSESWESTVRKFFAMSSKEMYAQMGEYSKREIAIALTNTWARSPVCPGSRPDDPIAKTVPGCRF